MDTGKQWYASKTIIFNVIALVVLVAGAFGFGDFQADMWVAQAATAIIAAVNLWLRFQTARPIES